MVCKRQTRLGALAWCRVEDTDEPPDPEPPSKSEKKVAQIEPPEPHLDDVPPEPRAPPEPAAREIRVCNTAGDIDGEFSQLAKDRLDGPLVYDVPWLHADAPAFQAEDGSVVLPSCPYCGERHRHRGFGHRLAHCADPGGRGYVLRPVRPASPASGAGRPLGP